MGDLDLRTRWKDFIQPTQGVAVGWTLLPLRIFLGATFLFAGLQKLANPGFFSATNPASIQAQLSAAARHSPIHSLLGHLVEHAVPLGFMIAFGEVAIGLGVLLGLWTRVAAAAGAALSFGLFLTVSFHASPYYTGSDIVFVFAWLPFVVAGAGGVLALDAIIPKLVEERLSREQPRMSSIQRAGELDRRAFATRGAAAVVAGAVGLVVGGLAAGIGRLAGGSTGTTATPTLNGTGSTSTASTASPSPTTTAPPAASHPSGQRLGPATDVPLGGAASFTDPSSGDPALVVQPSTGTFLAFDAVCPHAGCTVQFSTGERQFICPCHASVFNATTGAVESGPAATGLRKIQIAEGSDGQLYAT